MYHRQSRPCGNEFTDDNYNFLTIQHNDQVRNAMTMSILTDKSLCGSNSPLLSDIVQIINSFASQEDFITIVVKKVSDLAKSTTELTELTRMVVPRDFFQCFANDVGVSSGRYGRVVYVHRQDLLFPDLADAIMENGQTSSYELVMLNDAYWSMTGFTELWRYTIHRFNERDTFRLPKPLRSNSLSDQMPDKWIAKWLTDMELVTMYELLRVAMSLKMQDVVEYCSAALAAKIKGQPLDKIKSILSVKT